jgi:hypothetical protein
MFYAVDLQNFENFGHWEAHWFEFQNLGDWKSLKIWNGAGPTCQPQTQLKQLAPITSVHMVMRRWPYTTGHHDPTWVGLLIIASGHHQSRTPPISLPPFTIRLLPPRCSAPHQSSLHPPSPVTDEPPPSSSTRPKEPSCHWAPPALRTCPRRHLSTWARHRWQPPPVVLWPRWPYHEFRIAKELLPDHFSGRLDHSSGPSPAPPPRPCTPP